MKKHAFLEKIKPIAIFFVAYSILFILFAQTISFTLPFLIGLLAAVALQPLYRFLQNKLRLRPTAASLLSVLLTLIVLGGLMLGLSLVLVSEISSLIRSLATADISALTEPVMDLIGRIGDYVKSIDASFLTENQNQIITFVRSSLGVIQFALGVVLSIVSSIPTIFTMLMVSVFSTYFFTKDYSKMKASLRSVLSSSAIAHASRMWSQGGKMLSKYVRSYLLIYGITFLETLVLFSVLGVPYPLVLSIVAGISDVIPVLGPGTIYIPVALIALFNGNIFLGVALILGWLLVTVIRQVIEPKIVSASIDIHPLAMLAVLYIGLKAGSFWIMIYLTGLFLLYKLFVRVGLLKQFFPRPTEAEKSGGISQSPKNEENAKVLK